jgi:hypothetical protein
VPSGDAQTKKEHLVQSVGCVKKRNEVFEGILAKKNTPARRRFLDSSLFGAPPRVKTEKDVIQAIRSKFKADYVEKMMI